MNRTSTWISKATLLAGVLALAGCDQAMNVTRSAPQQVRLADGLVVAGARGWCVDQETTQASADAAVVVLGSCAAIAGNPIAPRPDVPGVVTVSVDGVEDGVPRAEALEQFFSTAFGRAALARDGRPDSVTILETRRQGDLLFLHAEDKSADSAQAEDYWRALFGVNGRFVTVSLVGLSDQPIPRDKGLSTLAAQVRRLKSANDG